MAFLIKIATSESDIILDFFAGSGTTAQAVLELNKDGGNRRFILVQLPEPTGRPDYPTITEITKERVRRVIQKMNDAEAGQLPLSTPPDRGFRVFKLAESNFLAWNAQLPRDPAGLARQLELHVDHIRPSRTPQDLLAEILLKSGSPLTAPIETIDLRALETLKVLTAYSVEGGKLLICLDNGITLEHLRAMADLKPKSVILLDRSFAGNDALKANAVQIFKTHAITFKTV